MSERHLTTEDFLPGQHEREPRNVPESFDDVERQQREDSALRESTDVRQDSDVQQDSNVRQDSDVRQGTDVDAGLTRADADAGMPQQRQEQAALFEQGEADRLQEQWRSVQFEFVDDPRAAVRQADELVAQVIQRLAETFATHKRTLEEQWSRGDEVQTEDLRLALQQYRTFFQKLLAVR